MSHALADQESRQTFLGSDADDVFRRARVGIVGLSGGGSHVAQQLAHVGFHRFLLLDPAAIAETDLNRVVGARRADVDGGRLKVRISSRVIRGLRPRARVVARAARWQQERDRLAVCDLVFGCLDGLQERAQLEAFLRRCRIPLIDVGLDVLAVGEEAPRMAGQVIASVPGHPCMRCFRFLTDEALSIEARRYGDAGPRAQVVWANGVLASTAVGMGVQLLTNWTRERPELYLSYDGNLALLRPHPCARYAPAICPHFPSSSVGDARFRSL